MIDSSELPQPQCHCSNVLTVGIPSVIQATLHPGQATTVLSDRIRVINKIHADIADFLQVLRPVPAFPSSTPESTFPSDAGYRIDLAIGTSSRGRGLRSEFTKAGASPPTRQWCCTWVGPASRLRANTRTAIERDIDGDPESSKSHGSALSMPPRR